MSKAYTLGFKAIGVIKRTASGVGQCVSSVGNETILTISTAFEHKF